MCYVNSTLNLLQSNNDFASFFKAKKYLELDQDPVNFPISSEISKLFNPHDGGVKSAAELRQLVAVQSDQPQFATWDQQDVTEFLRTLLEVLVAEFMRNNCESGHSLIDKFTGREKLNIQFAVECLTCHYKPVDKMEEFDILSLDIFSSKSGSNLSQIIHQHYEKSEERELKCLCPDSDNKQVNVVTSMVQGPEYLFIELRRYRIVAGNQSKSKQVVNIDQVMTLPTGDQYSLLSVVDHQGDTIQSGHYVAFVKSGKFWYLVNDNIVTRVAFKSLSSPDNILLLYSKSLSEMVPSEPETVMVDLKPVPSVMVNSKPESSSKEAKSLPDMVTSQPESMLVKPVTSVMVGEKPESSAKKVKETCLKCGKKYQHIFRHIQGNDNCKEKYDFNAERIRYNKFISESKKKSKAKAKLTNPESFKAKRRVSDKKTKEKKKNINPESFIARNRESVKQSEAKKKKADPESFKAKNRESVKQSEAKKKKADPEGYAKIKRSRVKESKENKGKTPEGRIALFKEAVRYGAIFPCVCCQRVMFKQSVVDYNSVKEKIEKHEGLFEKAIQNMDLVPVIHGKHYLCLTCRKYLVVKGSMPPMSHCNNLGFKYVGKKLDLTDDDGNKIGEYSLTQEDIDNTNLTDLEQSLIARSLIFMKIHKLPRSGMGCVKDKLVYVPINESDNLNTLNTIIRTPSEAGILPIKVKVKRKQDFKHSYQEEYISIHKIIESLKLLVKFRHPSYKFLTKEMIDSYESALQDELVEEISDSEK